jgi:hypothetical protein
MEEILSRCGFLCDLYLAYWPSIEMDPSNRQVLSNGWSKYFGFRIEPESIIFDGCLNDRCPRHDREYPIMPCVIVKKLEKYALCDQNCCDKLKKRLFTFVTVQERFKELIPGGDRERFIVPYEKAVRFEGIRREYGL